VRLGLILNIFENFIAKTRTGRITDEIFNKLVQPRCIFSHGKAASEWIEILIEGRFLFRGWRRSEHIQAVPLWEALTKHKVH
jgi:hypothetical protein